MHELGILRQIVKTVERVAVENRIRKIRHITLEVGEFSSAIPMYLKKLYPVAVDSHPILGESELKIKITKGRGVQIKDIGY